MKKILPLFLIISSISAFAQEPADALRFSWTVPGGTARQQAIGGAMGSLGGDLSATFVNPAGLAFYRTGDFVFTPSYRFGNNKASYFDRTEKEKNNKFTLGTTGFVFGSGNRRGNIRSTAFSIGFNTSGDFRSNVVYRGANNQSSFSQRFLDNIRNENVRDSLAVVNMFGTGLALQSGWIDTVGGGTPGNQQFQSRAANLLPGELLQQQSINNRGGIYEFAIGGAANFKDKLLFGGSFGIPILLFEREAEFVEADATDNTSNNFNFATFSEKLSTKGVGINAKLGLIYKPQEFWRLGFAFHTPTLYSLTDRYDVEISADAENGKGTRAFGSGESEFTYQLVTPYRLMGSVSYVLREIEDVTKQKGFITADVEYVNYKAASFQQDAEADNSPEVKDYLDQLNDAIDNAYKSAFNFRAGGELKFTTLMVRLGAAYYGNPYKNIAGEKGHKVNLSGGLGYRDRGMFIDLTYVHNLNRDVHFPYRLQNAPYAGARINTSAGNVLLTAGFKF
ncbi:MAG: aromatic hydrocarbon degradation protein [Bacteroidota bacterium]|nr:aromatic hydrocarbon degradation protein [Bacteroidota bacterium]